MPFPGVGLCSQEEELAEGTANLVTNSSENKTKQNIKLMCGDWAGAHLQILRFKALINKGNTES